MAGKSEHAGRDKDVATIERAMVAIRRAQTRRALARLSAGRGARTGRLASLPDAVFELLDAVDAITDAPAGRGTKATESPGRGTSMPPTVSEVAVAMGVDQPRASRLAGQALAGGLLRRGVDQADGRRSPLIMTPSGRAALDRIHAFRQQVIAQSTADWSAADRATFARLLQRFVADFSAVTDPVAR